MLVKELRNNVKYSVLILFRTLLQSHLKSYNAVQEEKRGEVGNGGSEIAAKLAAAVSLLTSPHSIADGPSKVSQILRLQSYPAFPSTYTTNQSCIVIS